MLGAILYTTPMRNLTSLTPKPKPPLVSTPLCHIGPLQMIQGQEFELLLHHYTLPVPLLRIFTYVAKRISASKFQSFLLLSVPWYDPSEEPVLAVARWWNLTNQGILLEQVLASDTLEELRAQIYAMEMDLEEDDARDHAVHTGNDADFALYDHDACNGDEDPIGAVITQSINETALLRRIIAEAVSKMYDDMLDGIRGPMAPPKKKRGTSKSAVGSTGYSPMAREQLVSTYNVVIGSECVV